MYYIVPKPSALSKLLVTRKTISSLVRLVFNDWINLFVAGDFFSSGKLLVLKTICKTVSFNDSVETDFKPYSS